MGRELSNLLDSVQPPGLGGDWWMIDAVNRLEASPIFESFEYAEFPHAQQIGRDGLLGLVSSRSYVIEMDTGRRRRLLDRVGDLYDVAASGAERLTLPYRTQCWRATVAPYPP